LVILNAMPDFGESIGEIGGTIRAMLGLTQRNRMRDQIRATLELYELTAKYEELSSASEDLAQIVSEETRRLLETSNATGRQWNWGAWFMSWIIAAGCGVGIYLLRVDWGSWWATLLIVILGFAGAMFFLAGLGVLLQRKRETV